MNISNIHQFAQQFVAALHYVNTHHDFALLSPTDRLVANKNGSTVAGDEESNAGLFPCPRSSADITSVDPKPEGVFLAGLRELARDLITQEQKIELLISNLPGLKNSEKDQEERIRVLEKQIKEEEEKRKASVKKKELILTKVENVIRSVKRP